MNSGGVGQMKNHAKWKQRIRELADYALHHDGNANVPQVYPSNKSLGIWVHNQRCQYKNYKSSEKCQLNLERIKSLDDLSFQW
jgi:arginine/lysine/ornithine decarboxylase